MRFFHSDDHQEVIASLVPLCCTMFLFSFLALNHLCGRVWPIPRRLSLAALALVSILGLPASLFYLAYLPPDNLSSSSSLALVSCHRAPPNPPQLIKVKIISYADGKAVPLGRISARLNARYADRHKFAWFMYRDCRPRLRHLQWTKIALLHLEMEDPNPPEWLIWVDADAVFVEQGLNVYEGFLKTLPTQIELVVAEDIGGSMPINTGVMMVRTGENARRLLELIWDTGRELGLLRRWFHEQGTLTHLYQTHESIHRAVMILGSDTQAFRVKMYTDGSLPLGAFPKEPFAWRPGDHIAHAIGPKKGGTNKLKALEELEKHILAAH